MYTNKREFKRWNKLRSTWETRAVSYIIYLVSPNLFITYEYILMDTIQFKSYSFCFDLRVVPTDSKLKTHEFRRKILERHSMKWFLIRTFNEQIKGFIFSVFGRVIINNRVWNYKIRKSRKKSSRSRWQSKFSRNKWIWLDRCPTPIKVGRRGGMTWLDLGRKHLRNGNASK